MLRMSMADDEAADADPPRSSDHRRRERRPRSDRATLLGTVIAIIALGWAIYAYYYPRTASDAAASPRPAASGTAGSSSSAAGSAPAPATTPAPLQRVVMGWAASVSAWASTTVARFYARYERDRYHRSWWALLLIWFAMAAFALWTLFEDMPFLFVPLVEYAYVDYYGPSLSMWGTAISIVGGIVVTLTAFVVWVDRRL